MVDLDQPNEQLSLLQEPGPLNADPAGNWIQQLPIGKMFIAFSLDGDNTRARFISTMPAHWDASTPFHYCLGIMHLIQHDPELLFIAAHKSKGAIVVEKEPEGSPKGVA